MAHTESRHSRDDRNVCCVDVSSLLDCDMTVRSLTVQRKHEAFVKGVAQASDGLCCVFSIGAGRLLFAAARDRAADLNNLVNDLERELSEPAECCLAPRAPATRG